MRAAVRRSARRLASLVGALPLGWPDTCRLPRSGWREARGLARPGRGWLLVLLAVLLVVPAAPRDAVAQGGAPPALFGVAGHAWWLDPHFDQFLALYRDLGVTGVRVAVDWKQFEAQEGQYDFGIFDRVLSRLNAAGLEITAVFVTVPPWVASDPAGCRASEQGRCDVPAAREPQLRAAARAAVARYPYVRRWEVGNEPELWRYLGNNAADYVRVLRAFYAEAKAVDPGVQVAAATVTGWDYVHWLYEQADERPWDAITFHPYGGGAADADPAPSDLASDDPGTGLRTAEIDRLRAGMVAQGDGAKPIWITEYGWMRDPASQATRLRAALTWMASRPWITTAHLHMLHDAYGETYGLTSTIPPGGPSGPRTQFVPKQPYYDAFKSFPRAR
jgi:hypothetical protein